MDTALFAIWFFLPAGIANTLPIIAASTPHLRRWTYPLDFGGTFREHRIFGPHKTWRGLVVGIVGAVIVVYLQQQYATRHDLAFLDRASALYLEYPALLLGLLFGLGALGGDAVKSFVKRQLNVPSGRSWFPFDQLDYIIGACLMMVFVVVLSLTEYAAILLIWFVTHLVFSYLGYRLKLKSSPI